MFLDAGFEVAGRYKHQQGIPNRRYLRAARPHLMVASLASPCLGSASCDDDHRVLLQGPHALIESGERLR
jgi:hypothetical protein